MRGDDYGGLAGFVRPKSERTTAGIEPDTGEASPMQRIAQGRSLPDRSPRSLRQKRGSSSTRTGRITCATGVANLAPAFTQALPRLDGLPTSYSHELRGELLYELCAALVREGLGGPDTWIKCEDSAVVFAQRAIMEAIGEERWNLLQRNVEYHLSVSRVQRDWRRCRGWRALPALLA